MPQPNRLVGGDTKGDGEERRPHPPLAPLGSCFQLMLFQPLFHLWGPGPLLRVPQPRVSQGAELREGATDLCPVRSMGHSPQRRCPQRRTSSAVTAEPGGGRAAIPPSGDGPHQDSSCPSQAGKRSFSPEMLAGCHPRPMSVGFSPCRLSRVCNKTLHKPGDSFWPNKIKIR